MASSEKTQEGGFDGFEDDEAENKEPPLNTLHDDDDQKVQSDDCKNSDKTNVPNNQGDIHSKQVKKDTAQSDLYGEMQSATTLLDQPPLDIFKKPSINAANNIYRQSTIDRQPINKVKEDEVNVAKNKASFNEPIAKANVSNRPILKTSKSFPLFHDEGCSNTEDGVTVRGSETNLNHAVIEENRLPFAQSYTNPLNAPSPGTHKVQFVESRKPPRELPAVFPTVLSPGGSLRGVSSPHRKKRPRKVSELSQMSVNSSTGSTSTTFSYTAPDGGYGWVVVLASFFVNMIADGVTFSFGVMFDEFEKEFGESKAVTAGVVSVFHAVPLLTGPIATWLTDRYSCRVVTIVGAILAATGFLLSAFSHHIVLIYLFFGLVSGFGLSLCYVAAIIIVAYYFDRKRSFATGLSVCGSGVGTFLFAPLTQYLIEEWGGWRGACIILAGIFLNMCVCGALFRDLEWTKLKRRGHSNGSLGSKGSDQPCMPEIEELRALLETGGVAEWLENGNENMNPRLACSLLNIPTYIKNPSQVPEEVLLLLATNRQTYDYILDNFPNSLIAKSISDYGNLNKNANGKATNINSNESTGVKLKKKVSLLFKEPRSILKKITEGAVSESMEDEKYNVEGSNITKDKTTVKEERPIVKEDKLVMKEDKAVMKDDKLMIVKDDKPVANGTSSAVPNGVTRQNQRSSFRVPGLPTVTGFMESSPRLQRPRASITYRGACLVPEKIKQRSTSCPDIYRRDIEEDYEVEEKEVGQSSCCSLKYLTLPFILFCISNCILYAWYDIPYVYTIDYAEFDLHFSSQKSTHIISVIGILNTIGEFVIGWLGDKSWMPMSILYCGCMVVCGLCTAVIPFVSDYSIICTLSALYGFCISANYSLTSPILIELVSLEQFSSAYGILLASQGISNLVGPPFAGWLYDISQKWYLTFCIGGLFIALSGLLLLVIPIIRICKCKSSEKEAKYQIEEENDTNSQNKPTKKNPEGYNLVVMADDRKNGSLLNHV